MKSSYAMALVIALAAVGWLASPYLTGGTANEVEVPEATPAAVVTKAPMRVQVRESIAEIRINSLILTGQTEPSRHATVSAETAARVIAVEAEEGSVVKKGDIIVRLATDDREALLAEARALLKHRQIEYSAANKLSSKGYQTQTKLAETSANLESAEAHLRRIEIDMERTVIRAPFDGVIQTRMVEVGDYLKVGSPVALVIDLDPLIAVAQVSEREIAGVVNGVDAKVRLVTGDIIDGRVRYVSSVGSEGTRTFRVELEIDNAENRLAAGLTAEIRLPVAAVEAHNMSPAALTLDDTGVIGVKIVDARNIVRFHPIQLVSDGLDGVWIGGLPREATIITVGQEFVLPGQTVTPVPQGATPSMAKPSGSAS
ncbi:MAG: efflux RND transporter periplasmic adaptor subunit [Alphaproteobacteria bacterium]|nr:efflux RND transporter periplasmic adaptor subunit [Alphaproteobacteria bacterium]